MDSLSGRPRDAKGFAVPMRPVPIVGVILIVTSLAIVSVGCEAPPPKPKEISYSLPASIAARTDAQKLAFAKKVLAADQPTLKECEEAYIGLESIKKQTDATFRDIRALQQKRDHLENAIVAAEKRKANEAARKANQEIADTDRANLKYFEGLGDAKLAVASFRLERSYGGHSSRKGGVFVVVDIAAKNDGAGVIHVNPLSFTLSDADGYTVPTHDSMYEGNYLRAVDLGGGQSTSGRLVFYTYKSSKYNLLWRPLGSAASVKTLRP